MCCAVIDTYNMVFASHVLESAGKEGNRALITFVVVVSSSGFACDLLLQMFLSLRAQNKSARFRCSRKIPSRTDISVTDIFFVSMTDVGYI